MGLKMLSTPMVYVSYVTSQHNVAKDSDYDVFCYHVIPSIVLKKKLIWHLIRFKLLYNSIRITDII